MRATLLASAVILVSATTAAAQSNITRIVEPVQPTMQAIINAPIEYNDQGIVKAQHFNADSLSDEEYQALLDEADRIRTYQGYTTPVATEAVTINTVEGGTTQTSYDGGYQVEIYTPDATAATTATTDSWSTQSYDGFTSSATYSEPTTYSEPITYTEAATTTLHVVAKGDTLYSLSKRYNVSISALQETNALSGTALGLGQALSIPSAGIVRDVQALNTSIAQPIFASAPVRDGYVTRRVVEPLAKPATNAAVSTAKVYRVLPKDTLYSISRQSCVSVKDIISNNTLLNPNKIAPGQAINLPNGHCLAN